MGVSMTPHIRIIARRGLGVASVLTLCAYAVVVGAEHSISGESKSAPNPSVERKPDSRPSNTRPASPLMSWRGQTEIGFVRVELWDSENERSTHELVVQTSRGRMPVERGCLVVLPETVAKTTGLTQLFILSSDGARSGSIVGPLFASILSDGSLRMYPVGRLATLTALDLKPTQ
jgi:hypothetical protein